MVGVYCVSLLVRNGDMFNDSYHFVSCDTLPKNACYRCMNLISSLCKVGIALNGQFNALNKNA